MSDAQDRFAAYVAALGRGPGRSRRLTRAEAADAMAMLPRGEQASVNGVFHPPYIETHLAAAPMLGQRRLLVLKGGGGEAERNPAKPVTVHVFTAGQGCAAHVLPPLCTAPPPSPEPSIAAVWRGEAHHAAIAGRIIATIALGLMAVGRGGDAEAQALWENRRVTG